MAPEDPTALGATFPTTPAPDGSTRQPTAPAPSQGCGVLLAVRDLFFRVKLETALKRLGIAFGATGAEPLVSVAARVTPEVVILDLSDPALEPLEALRALRTHPELERLPVVGFASHMDRALREAARRAGCSVVVSRSRIAAALPEVIEPFISLPGRRP